jgi:antitoxin ParD1/3/4
MIQANEKRKAEEQLEAKLLEGLSGVETALSPAEWVAIRQEALGEVAARRQSR